MREYAQNVMKIIQATEVHRQNVLYNVMKLG